MIEQCGDRQRKCASGRCPITVLMLIPTFSDNKAENRDKYVLIEAMPTTSISRTPLFLLGNQMALISWNKSRERETEAPMTEAPKKEASKLAMTGWD